MTFRLVYLLFLQMEIKMQFSVSVCPVDKYILTIPDLC